MQFDLVLVGGGLQNALIALAVRARRPDARIALVEQAPQLGGDHTWCFHEGDVSSEARAWIEPLVVARWSSWETRFTGGTRVFSRGYFAIDSARLHDVVGNAMASHAGSAIWLGRAASAIDAQRVTLDDGTTLDAPLVVDARGPAPVEVAAGWQKFVGLELTVATSAPIARPIVMDATCGQRDGLRFFYVLPLSPTRVLIEETYFSDAEIDEGACTGAILSHAAMLGLRVSGVARVERGALPLPLVHRPAPQSASPLLGGYRGGWFHPTTGYSLPAATRVAEHLAVAPFDAPFDGAWRRLVDAHERQSRYAVMLNRLLFLATDPARRRAVLERFHTLPDDTVARFYALSSTSSDRLRIVCGRPPAGVSWSRALREAVRS